MCCAIAPASRIAAGFPSFVELSRLLPTAAPLMDSCSCRSFCGKERNGLGQHDRGQRSTFHWSAEGNGRAT